MTVYYIGEFAVIDMACDECDKHESIVIDRDLYEKWDGVSTMNVETDEFELLTTGVHLDCWEKMFA